MSRSRLVLLLLLTLLASALWAAPRNIILLIGDGMGPDIVTAAGAFQYGAQYHRFGGNKRLALEMLAGRYYATTYSTSGAGYDFTWQDGNAEYAKKGSTDSAAAGTALATGVKTYNGAISVDVHKNPLVSISELARKVGYKVGVTTSVFFYDATPACFAAHNAGRGNAREITHEILMITQPDVLIGAGNPDCVPAEQAYAAISKEDWDAVKAGKTPYRLIQKREEFQALAEKPATGKVLGLISPTAFSKSRNADGKGADAQYPTLAEMTLASLNTLANPQGFFLMVEGGAIDKFAHGNNLDATIGETLAFDDAVAATVRWIEAHGGWEANLLIVTADHDTGYLRNVKPNAAGALPTAAWGTDGKWGGHTNRLVPVFCQGKGSEAFNQYALRVRDFEHGLINVVDNTAVFQVMRTALPATR
ncbi:MAG: alkaline phosphatase [Armatimonadota bacterium]